MKVILLADIKGVGKKDEVINVSDGYVRNYLLPKKLAVEANTDNMNRLKSKQDSINHRKDVEREEAKKVADKIEKIRLKISVKTGENGKIFGGVTAKEIADHLKEQYKITVDKKKIDLKETVKVTGVLTVSIKLYDGVIGKLKVDIIPQ